MILAVLCGMFGILVSQLYIISILNNIDENLCKFFNTKEGEQK